MNRPALVVSSRLALLEYFAARLQRFAMLATAGLVVVAVAGELYRAGYKDGYRLADQVGADRPADVAEPMMTA